MTKIIDEVIDYTKRFAKQGFSFTYAPEENAKLVQVYICGIKKVMVTGPPKWVNKVREAIEGN